MFSFMWDTFSTVAYWFIAIMVIGNMGAWAIGFIAIGVKWVCGVRHGR